MVLCLYFEQVLQYYIGLIACDAVDAFREIVADEDALPASDGIRADERVSRFELAANVFRVPTRDVLPHFEALRVGHGMEKFGVMLCGKTFEEGPELR